MIKTEKDEKAALLLLQSKGFLIVLRELLLKFPYKAYASIFTIDEFIAEIDNFVGINPEHKEISRENYDST